MPARPQPGFEAIMAEMANATVDATLARIEAAMEEMTRNYDTLKTRIQNVESTAPSYDNRLSQLEKVVRPYNEYAEECQNAIEKLKGLRTRLEADRSEDTKRNKTLNAKFEAIDQKFQAVGRSFDGISTVPDKQDEINESVKSLLLRVQQLETQASSQSDGATLKSVSALDLAKALLDRLAAGETLDGDTMVRLSLSLGKASDPAPQTDRTLFTPPTTDLESASRTAGESGPKREPPSSRKRTRKPSEEMNSSVSSPTKEAVVPPKKRRGRPAKSMSNLGTKTSTASTMAGAVQETEGSRSDENEDEQEREGSTTPTIRRSGREPRPSKKHENYYTWTQVKNLQKM